MVREDKFDIELKKLLVKYGFITPDFRGKFTAEINKGGISKKEIMRVI